jgi:serine/threonine protein kinase
LSSGTLRAVKESRVSNYDCRAQSDFIREVEMLYENVHPTTLRVYNFGFPDSAPPWIEMDFIPAGSVFDLLGSPALTPTRRLIILFGVAFAISFLHAKCIAHRDVKSSNVLLDHALEPHLGDFGFARELLPSEKILSHPHTLNYAAPEILQKGRYTEKVDVYAFGMFVYEVVAGRVPYAGVLASKITDLVLCGQRPELNIDDPYSELYRMCTAANPRDRPAMADLVSYLGECARFVDGVDVAEFEEYRDRVIGYQVGGDLAEFGTVQNLTEAAGWSPKAMVVLGWMYYKGVGLAQDVAKAAELFARAGDRDNTEAIGIYLEMMDTGVAPRISDEAYLFLSQRYDSRSA